MASIRQHGAARRFLLAVPLALAVGGLIVSGSPAALAGDINCSVTNATHPMGVIGGLATAVDLATAGDTLHVRGTCKGLTTIDKRITIVGKPSDTLGPPTLDGNGVNRAVVVEAGRKVKITDLTIQFGLAPGPDGERTGGNIDSAGNLTLVRVRVENGNADRGGGIFTSGTLTVIDSVFYGNEADAGGAIWAGGPVTLKGTTEISTNFAADGAGVYAIENLTIAGSTTIHHNEATNSGGGIAFARRPGTKSVLRMAGTAVVHTNKAPFGGGVWLGGGAAILDDRANVRGNTATVGGGMYLSAGALTLNDTTSVRGNQATEAAGIETLPEGRPVRITMTGRSSVKGNIASGQTAAIRLTGSLTMRDKSVVRDNVDQGGFAAISTGAQPDWPVTFTMRDDSRVTSHELAPRGSAVARVVGCGKTTYIGVKARVVGNTPKNIKTIQVLC
jgi:hypothetical protein